jgi:chromosome segregation protein
VRLVLLLLRKLEAYGFKSFAEKTEMEFKPGITAIVGPNGSGKSNISDAVRWVLGEQNIRNLRGSKMEDVIFSGSAKRRPLGVAEVSLIFDNSDGLLPLEYNEVTITRRVFRSGEGEYFINKSACRLKDIHDLLIDAGLGRESMTVISQNKIDEVLNSKADERRLLFEEAAGIIKFKNRKKDALRKLEDTEHNLTRVFDITSEIETQLGPLAESAERTARYNELASELTACQVTVLMDKLTNAEKNQESVVLEKASLTDGDIDISTRISVCDTDKERLTEQLAVLDESVKQIESAVGETATEIERTEGKAAVLTERIDQERKNSERLVSEQSRVENERTENLDKLQEWKTSLTIKQSSAGELEQLLDKQQSALEQSVAKISTVEKQVEEAKDQTFGHLQELVTQKNSLRTLERDSQLQIQRQNQLEKEQSDYQNQYAATQKLLTDTNNEAKALATSINEVDANLAALTAEKLNQEAALKKITIQENNLNSKSADLSSRLKVLSNMQEELEGFGRGTKSVLKSEAGWRSAVYGAVAQIIDVPQQYITAVEIALGGALQHVVVKDDATAKAAIQYLKTSNHGRATFLPLNTIKPAKPKDFEVNAAHANGALGFAADLIKCDQQYRHVVDYLLGRTVVARDIDAALRISKQHGFGLKIVTLEGELLNPGGSMTGGSTGRREASYLGRENEISSLRDQISALENERTAIIEQAQSIRERLEALASQIETALNNRRSLEVRKAEIAVHAEKTQLDLKRIQMAVNTLAAEHKTSLAEAQQISNRILEVSNNIKDLESRDSEHKRQLATWQDELRSFQNERDTTSNSLTDTKIKLSALLQEINAIKANCTQYEQNQSRINRQLQSLEAEQKRISDHIKQANDELGEIARLKDKLLKHKAEQETQRSTKLGEKLSVIAKQQKLDRELRDLRRKQNTIQSRLHELALLETRFSYDVAYCNEQLRDHFGMTKEQALLLHRLEEPEKLAAKIAELEQAIDILGPVNHAAIDEYTRLKERYEFLRTQYLDLTEAKEYLTTIIKDIDATMSKQFKAAFQKINENFGDLFVRLFGGGKAQLQLLEPDDILNSGIEIIVQPPGKKQQNLALLSGGERALTVIALLFAFLTYRPTPFCVLDEIDAALDEANVQRFSEFLRDFSRNTQFIIVTHRKGTMEVADVMHGVTMEESGISKLISVKFMDKAG